MLDNMKEKRAVKQEEKEKRKEEKRIQRIQEEQARERRELITRIEEERKERIQIETEKARFQHDLDRLNNLSEKELFVELIVAVSGMRNEMMELQARQLVHEKMIEEIEESVSAIDYDEEISDLWRAINDLTDESES